MPVVDPALSPDDIELELNIPRSTVFLLVRRGDLRGFRAGRHLRVRRSWLEEYIAAQEIKPDSDPEA